MHPGHDFPGKTHVLALVYDLRTLSLFVDGKKVLTPLYSRQNGEESEISELIHPLARQFENLGTVFGVSTKNAADPRFFNGIIDEIRISNTARYTEDFTPEKRFENDEHTLALYHMDEGSGDVLKDSSGNGHHGKIFGAKWVRVDDELNVIEEGQLAQPTDPYARDRKMAEWVISQGGRVQVVTGRVSVTANTLDELPESPFVLAGITFENAAGITDESISRFAEHAGLEMIVIENSELLADGLAALSSLPQLRDLAIHGTSCPTSAFRHCPDFENLTQLAISAEQVDDDWKFLQLLPKLRQLNVYGRPVPNLDLIPKHLGLHTIDFLYSDIDAEKVKNLNERNPNLRVVNLGKNSTSHRLVGKDPSFAAAKTLSEKGWRFSGRFRDGGEWTSDSEDSWKTSKPVLINTVVFPEDHSLTDAEKSLLPRVAVSFNKLQSNGLRDVDELIPSLVACRKVGYLQLGKSDLTDKGLQLLVPLSPGGLHITGTQVTKEGVIAFKEKVPYCKVISDFGIFPYEHKLPPSRDVPAEERSTFTSPQD